MLKARALDNQCYVAAPNQAEDLDTDGTIMCVLVRAHFQQSHFQQCRNSRDCNCFYKLFIKTEHHQTHSQPLPPHHTHSLTRYGDTVVIDPMGQRAAEVTDSSADEIVFADLSLEMLRDSRDRIPLSSCAATPESLATALKRAGGGCSAT